jgi:hypothetical protein
VAAVVWLDTPRPTNTFGPIAIVSLATSVHAVPSTDWYAETALPTRSSLTQYGAVAAVPALLELWPPVMVRRWKASPLPAETSMKPCADPGCSVSRIITPAFTQAAVPCSPETRASMRPSPVSCLKA